MYYKKMIQSLWIFHYMKKLNVDLVDESVIHKNGWFLYGSTKPHTDNMIH